MNKLHIDSVTKSFGRRKILQDVYLSCETGKISAVLGPPGGGKSTLLQIIFGTIKGDTQFIKFNDTVLKNQSDRKSKIAYLPQRSFFLPKEYKIRKLIALLCSKENTELLYNLTLMQPYLDETIRNLSTGEKRIVEVLVITHSDSKFILLDEPFSGISPKYVDELKMIIKSQSKYKGMIISDHNYTEILDISDDVYLLTETNLKKVKDITEHLQFS